LKYFGSISEKIDKNLKKYIDNESVYQTIEKLGKKAPKLKYDPVKGDTFRKMYFLKYMRSIVHPGENVGCIAA
jgi:hypothetical protein